MKNKLEYLIEDTQSTDVGQYAPLILPLVQKIYPESLVSQIASIQPTKSPVAKIAALYSLYTGNASNDDNGLHIDAGPTWTNSKIITVPVSAGNLITVGSSASSGSNVLTVFYKENSKEYDAEYTAGTAFSSGTLVSRQFSDIYTHLLVRVDSGNVVTGDTFTFAGAGAQVIEYATQNRNIIKRIFTDYSKVIENNSNLKQVNFEVRTSNLQTQSRKIATTFTQEKLQDFEKLYGENSKDLVAKYIANEIQQEIDREVIAYLKDISTPMAIDIDLTQSMSKTGGDMGGVTYDLYNAIFMAIEEIVRATKRNRTMFVLADSTTAAFLTLNGLHSEITSDESNPYLIAKIGAYPLFSDPYSSDHYVIVGYRYYSDVTDDAGLIFSPYTSTIVEATDPVTFRQKFISLNRYAYTRHPQDSGTGEGDSDFFRYFAVNYFDQYSPLPNLSDIIRRNY